MSFEQLKKVFNETQKELVQTTQNFSWTDRDSYASWIACSYNYVENSTRLLALAGGMMPSDKTAFSNRFIAHAAEEKGHEKLLANDIKGLGLSLDVVKPTFEMQVYSRSLSYWVSPNGNPIGLIGWVLSLEGVAASIGPKVYEQTFKKFGPKATSFLKVHAEDDPDHLEKALNIAKELKPDDMAIVSDSLKMYSYQYQKVLYSIDTAYQTKKKAA